MGNCVFRGFGGFQDMIKVVTSNGGIMELYSPITAECITNEFPGHRLFRSRDLFSQPLLHNEELHGGELYYLLPLINNTITFSSSNSTATGTASTGSSSMVTPYRMSFDNQGQGQGQGQGVGVKQRSEAEVFPRYNSTGVWKVKLVISPEQLSEILSQDARTEALIESVRTVAKCGKNGVPPSSSASSVANSDQCSLSGNTSNWKDSSEKL